MTDLPTGTVTFLFTDIEGSTRLWEQHPEAMRVALARHDAVLRDAIVAHGGSVFKTVGDQFCAAFPTAAAALDAVLAAQRALSGLLIDDCRLRIEGTVLSPNQQSAISNQQFLKVRMALHSGLVEARDGDYFGPVLNRVARILAAGHGGQILLSQATADAVRPSLPDAASLRALGSHRLKDLLQPEALFQCLHPDLSADFPPLRSLEAFAHNLPRQLTSFIGREAVIAEVKQLLATIALLTLTGAGGCGKTRLALQVGADQLDASADGVWLVELAALADPALVPQALATVLGVREEPGRPLTATLIDHLRSKSLLLLLDNCEHLLTACAHLAELLLRSCPNVRVLATSREGLGITGEMTYRVPSLSLPDPRHLPSVEEDRVAAVSECEAVRLFVDRAMLCQPAFTITPTNAAAVAQVCHQLDGIPLAIELAAVRMKALPVEQIAARLDDCFRLLTGGSRTALPRQQTLRALIDWSYNLLTEPERMLLRRLSVFAGGWTLEAAEAVCSGLMIDDCRLMIEGTPDPSPISNHQSSIINPEDVLDLLASLVEKSLVVYEERSGTARYRLLETVRQYGRDRLLEAGEAEEVRGRHGDYFLSWVEGRPPGESQAQRLGRMEEEHDNLRVALAWTQTDPGAGETGLRLATAVCDLWIQRDSWSEGRSWTEGALAHPGAAAPTAARCLTLLRASDYAVWLVDDEAARRHGEEALTIARQLGDMPLLARSLRQRGGVAASQGEDEKARALCEESLALSRKVGDTTSVAWALLHLGTFAVREGDDAKARAFYEESMALFRGLGPGEVPIWMLKQLSLMAWDRGDPTTAHSLAVEALKNSRWLGRKTEIGTALETLGELALKEQEYSRARALYAEAFTLYREAGAKRHLLGGLEYFARLAGAVGEPERVARLWGAVEALSSAARNFWPLPPAERVEHERQVASARAVLGEEAFAAAWADGKAMSLEQATRYALEEDDA